MTHARQVRKGRDFMILVRLEPALQIHDPHRGLLIIYAVVDNRPQVLPNHGDAYGVDITVARAMIMSGNVQLNAAQAAALHMEGLNG